MNFLIMQLRSIGNLRSAARDLTPLVLPISSKNESFLNHQDTSAHSKHSPMMFCLRCARNALTQALKSPAAPRIISSKQPTRYHPAPQIARPWTPTNSFNQLAKHSHISPDTAKNSAANASTRNLQRRQTYISPPTTSTTRHRIYTGADCNSEYVQPEPSSTQAAAWVSFKIADEDGQEDA